MAKIKSNQDKDGRRHFSMSRYRWEGRCLRLKTSTFKPCHIICQLSLTLNNVDDVKAVFLKPTFRLS